MYFSVCRYFASGDDHLPVLRDVREGQHRPQRLRAVRVGESRGEGCVREREGKSVLGRGW